MIDDIIFYIFNPHPIVWFVIYSIQILVIFKLFYKLCKKKDRYELVK